MYCSYNSLLQSRLYYFSVKQYRDELLQKFIWIDTILKILCDFYRYSLFSYIIVPLKKMIKTQKTYKNA